MRRIQKTISLEPLTSRVPSIMPAYKENVAYFFDDYTLKKREYLYPSNYGMVPINIVLAEAPSATTNYAFAYGEHCYDKENYQMQCDLFSGFTYFTISFETLQKWYHFFKEYYHLLNDYGHCGRVYSSAHEYYLYESRAKYAQEMVFGQDEQTYIKMDEVFASYGGKVVIDGGDAYDDGFFKWICEKIIPTYYISNEYADYWKRKTLYYPDVIRWMAWFAERTDYESVYSGATEDEPESWDCKSYSGDCCDCEEYFGRGGLREFERMKDWYRSVQDSISEINSLVYNDGKINPCFIPTIISPIELQTSLDDLGQFSIFSKEYELGIDYRVARYGDTANSYSGTVVTISGNPMILTSGEGFCYNREFMNTLYKEGDWKSYTEKYFLEHQDECVSSSYNFYTFDDDNVMKISSATTLMGDGGAIEDLSKQLEKRYPAETSELGWVYTYDGLYPIEEKEYGTIWNDILKKDIIYYVERDEFTNTPYTYIKNSKIYAEYYAYGEEPCYYFEMFKSNAYTNPTEVCGRTDKNFNINNYKKFPTNSKSTIQKDTIKYVNHIGKIYQIEDGMNSIEIDEVECPIIQAYGYIDESIFYYSNGVVLENQFGSLEYADENITYDESTDEFVVSVRTEPTVYSAKEITGKTVSKLYGLRGMNLLVDDIGNTIECLAPEMGSDIYSHQPAEGSEMEPIYQIGNVANINRMKITKTDVDEVENGEYNFFVGDIIYSMSFYYKELGGEAVEETRTSADETGGSSLDAIISARGKKEAKESENMIFEEDVYCDITYYIGATLCRKNMEKFKLAYAILGERYDYGVEYKETVRFKKNNQEYYLKVKEKETIPMERNIPGNHSTSYPIWVYTMEQDMSTVESTVYETKYDVALADFRCIINLMSITPNGIGTTFSNYEGLDNFNGIKVFPVLREEYLLGISSFENVDSDIYIERGINAAFEKHLKLGEVTSLETLEGYGLGYFKFMEN